jgi:Uma2 family endonuclease
MVVPNPTPATIDDLYRVEGKAELIGGRIVPLMPSGDRPAEVALEIVISLREYAKQSGIGRAYADNTGYALTAPLPSGRQAFVPDASYYTGPRTGMRFLDGAPPFAAEVRSEGDYGPVAESAMADKREDYFLAGTRVVWDVDPQDESVAVYRATDPEHPTTYRRGDFAEAEPAVPGWRLPVDTIFA